MGYIPTVWQTGDVITAEKLNKAERGIAAASSPSFYTNITYDDEDVGTLDKTFSDIEEAIEAGKICFVIEIDGSAHNYYLVSKVQVETNFYLLEAVYGSTVITLYAESEEGYPSTRSIQNPG